MPITSEVCGNLILIQTVLECLKICRSDSAFMEDGDLVSWELTQSSLIIIAM